MADISSLIEQMRAGRCRFQRSDIRRLLEHIAELEARTQKAGDTLQPNVDRLTAVDRLRLYATDAISFRFDQGDAEEVIEIIDAALALLPAALPAQEPQP